MVDVDLFDSIDHLLIENTGGILINTEQQLLIVIILDVLSQPNYAKIAQGT
jgi:hypothetical protein